MFYDPYFFLVVSDAKKLMEVSNHLERKFDGRARIEIVEKEDLDMPNHLSGKKNKLLKLNFNTVTDLMDIKSQLRYVVVKVRIYVVL